MTRRRRKLSDGLCRKRVGFVVIGFALMISSTLGISVDDSSKEVNNRRENFSRVADNVAEDSKSAAKRLHDYSQTNPRQLRGTPETLSKENSGREETAKLTEHGRIIHGTGNLARKGFYSKSDLSHRESGNERGLFEGGIGLRMLQSNVNETLEGTLAQVTANSTSVEENVVGMKTAGIVVGLTTALGVMAVLLSTLSWIFVYIYRKNRFVAIGQPPCKLLQTFLSFPPFRLLVYHTHTFQLCHSVLYLICFGSILLSSEMFFLFGYNFMNASTRDDSCVAQLWFRNIGSTCVHMAIFCKLWRAYKVAQFRKNQVVTPQHVIVPFIVLILAVIGVTIAITITDPPVWHLSYGVEQINIGMCLPESVNTLSIHEKHFKIEVTTVILQLVCLAMMLAMAYVARHIPEDISDARRVFWAVMAGFLLSAISYGLFWIGAWLDNSGLSAFSTSLRYFCDGIIFVAVLIVPKIYAAWQDTRNPPSNSARTTISMIGTSSRGRGQVHVSGLAPA